MDFRKYINEDVFIKRDDDFTCDEICGRLLKVVPAGQAGKCVETLICDVEGKEEEIPVNRLMQFLSKRDLNDAKSQYYYVTIRFGKTARSKEHIFMSFDHSIKPGDKVLVWRDWLYVGNVIRTGFYSKANAPYPVEKTWLIQEKVYDRIDFTKYADSPDVIRMSNEYKDKYLNAANDYRQYIAKVSYQYQWLADSHSEHLDNWMTTSSDHGCTGEAITAETEYNLDWEWCESNQVDVFFRTLWLCAYMAMSNLYVKFYFDKYLCLSLIYKHRDFDRFLLAPEIDKINIDRDICIVDKFISDRLTVEL